MTRMSNPGMKKDTFLSVWLSSANRLAGSLRAPDIDRAEREAKAVVADAAAESIRSWTVALTPLPAKKVAIPRR